MYRNSRFVKSARGNSLMRKRGVRNASSKEPAGPGKHPMINFDHTKGDSILHQKARKAAELHAELNQLLDQQAKRRADEAARGFGSGFIDFLKKSKSEVINIFATFSCVCLAYQIYNIRKGARVLIEETKGSKAKIEELKDILRFVSTSEFQENVTETYKKEMEKEVINGEKRGKDSGNWFGRKSDNPKTVGNESILTDILREELRKVIGDLALTDTDLEERKLAELQKEIGLRSTNKIENKMVSEVKSSSSFGGLEEVFNEVQNDGTPEKIVKRKGFI
eukprot:450862_1